MKELLNHKVFRIIMATDLVQQTCIWIRNISVLFFVIDRTGSDPVAVSLITVFEYLPMFVFSYIGGTMADRWNPKKTMIIGDFLSSVSVAAILLVSSMGVWQAVFAATLVSSAVSQFSVPSSSIIFKRFVDERLVTSAISISQSNQSLFLIIGPVIGTLLYGIAGIHLSLVIVAAMFAVSALVQFALPACDKNITDTKTGLLSEMKQGISYLAENSNLKIICVMLSLLGLAQGLIQPLAVYIAVERLGLSKESLQWFYSLSGIGLFAGAILSAAFIQKFKTGTVLFMGMLSFAAVTLIEVLSRVFAITAVMYLTAGVILAFLQIAVSSPLIKNVKQEYVGRISGLIVPLMTGGILLGSAVSGILMKQFSLIPVFCMSAFIMVLCGFIGRSYKSETVTLNNGVFS